MLLIEGLRSLQRPTYLQTPIGGHHHQLRSLDLVGQLTSLGEAVYKVPVDIGGSHSALCLVTQISDDRVQ